MLETCIRLYFGWWVWGYLAGRWEFYSWKEWTLVGVLVSRSYLTLFATPWSCTDPWSLLGSSVYGNSPGRILDWVAISFSRGSSQPRENSCLLHWQSASLPLSHLDDKHESIWEESGSFIVWRDGHWYNESLVYFYLYKWDRNSAYSNRQTVMKFKKIAFVIYLEKSFVHNKSCWVYIF